jgi:hypothetical protein
MFSMFTGYQRSAMQAQVVDRASVQCNRTLHFAVRRERLRTTKNQAFRTLTVLFLHYLAPETRCVTLTGG